MSDGPWLLKTGGPVNIMTAVICISKITQKYSVCKVSWRLSITVFSILFVSWRKSLRLSLIQKASFSRWLASRADLNFGPGFIMWPHVCRVPNRIVGFLVSPELFQVWSLERTIFPFNKSLWISLEKRGKCCK